MYVYRSRTKAHDLVRAGSKADMLLLHVELEAPVSAVTALGRDGLAGDAGNVRRRDRLGG